MTTQRPPFRHGLLWLATCMLPVAATAAELLDETRMKTLFAFDNVSIPHSQNLRLEMRAPERHPANPVLPRGPEGAPDSWAVQFYGSVIQDQGKYRMWYVAVDDNQDDKNRYARWRAAYAESQDGVNWVKPNLGLVEYNGNKDNNLIDIGPHPLGFVNLKVLKDEKDPDPDRRYKITTHVYFKHHTRLGSLCTFTSADGLRWKMVPEATPVNAQMRKEDLLLPAIHFEPCGGFYQWDGLFYICGQNALNATRPYHGRVTRLYHSPDFVTWSTTSAPAFIRTQQHTLLGPGRSLEGEQTHEGISVWNRNNLLLGVVGLWHGAKEWQDITVDLGFVVCNDGLNFREPAHEWTFLKRGDDGAWDQGGLLQGQGFENVGEKTLIYYGSWDPRQWKKIVPRGGVGIATLPRDRFGALVVEKAGEGPGDYQLPKVTSECVTAAIPVKPGAGHRLFLNAEGLGPKAALKVEVLGADTRPLPGLSGADAAVVRENGFQTPVSWGGKQALPALPDRIRLRVLFEGAENANIRFSALYLQEAE